jgi:hypothetical protein
VVSKLGELKQTESHCATTVEIIDGDEPEPFSSNTGVTGNTIAAGADV